MRVNSVFKVTPLKDPKLQRYKSNAIKELNAFFNRRWVYHTPRIFVVDDRKTINLLKEEKTKDWVVGWAWGGSIIFILNPKNISKESSHTNYTYNIAKLIKHELCHSFFFIIFWNEQFYMDQ